MEKNWIELIKEFITKAMSNKLYVNGYSSKVEDDSIYCFSTYLYYFVASSNNNIKGDIRIEIDKENITISTPKGRLVEKIELTSRDRLELDKLVLDVEEYCKEMALYEFNTFFNEDDGNNKKISIDDLDNEDD